MPAVLGLAVQGDPARGASRRLREATRRLARASDVRSLSRPWWTPARLGEAGGLLAASLVQAPVRAQRLRAWVASLERDLADPAVQLVPLAGWHRGRWRLAVDLADEPAWTGPLADAAPDLPLPSGRSAYDQAVLAPATGSRPWPWPQPAWPAPPVPYEAVPGRALVAGVVPAPVRRPGPRVVRAVVGPWG